MYEELEVGLYYNPVYITTSLQSCTVTTMRSTDTFSARVFSTCLSSWCVSHRMTLCNITSTAPTYNISTHSGRQCVQLHADSYAETSTDLVLRIIFVLGWCNSTDVPSILHLIVLAVSDGNLPNKNPGFFVLQKFQLLHFEASQHTFFTYSCKINMPI